MTSRIDNQDPGRSMTDWSMVLDAAKSGSPTHEASLTELVRRYWNPLYAFARSSGQNAEDANDTVQGFMTDVLLSRNLLASADPNRGRFRSLLFRSISNYMRDRHRKSSSTMRKPKGKGVYSLDDTESMYQAADTSNDPERSFMTHWAATLIRNALSKCRAELEGRNRHTEWMILDDRIIKPMLVGSEPTSYSVLVERLRLRDASQAANMLVVAKRAFAKAIIEEISDTITDKDDVEVEIHALLRILQKRDA